MPRPMDAPPEDGRVLRAGACGITCHRRGYAQIGGMPMMMITGQKPIKKSKQGRFQILDVVAMMGPITKYTHQLASSDNIPSRVREAFRLAEEEKPGAVHLELPEDIADEQTTSEPLKASSTADPTPTRRRCGPRSGGSRRRARPYW